MRKSSIITVLVTGLGLGLFFALRILPPKDASGQTALPVHVITLSLQDVPRMLGGRGTVESLHGAVGTLPMAAEFSLPENMLPILQQLIQDTDDPPVWAYADDQSPALLAEGRLTLIDNRATTPTVRVKAEFENPLHTLHPGQAVNLQLQTGWLRQVLAAPANVVRRGSGEDSFVYRLDGDRINAVPVKVVYSNVLLEVIEGVREGDVLVVGGSTALKPGTRVRIVTP